MKRHMPIPALLLAMLALAAACLLPSRAFAAFTVCQTDPTASLSNGQTVTLWVNINTDISNVTGVNYVLHIPSNLRVVSMTYDQYAAVENFSWVADQSGNRYEADTTVSTNASTGSVPVTAWASMPQGNNTYSTSGTSGQTLTINWKM